MGYNQFEMVRYIGPSEFAPQLGRGEIGTILEVYENDYYEIEFVNEDGSTKLLQAFPGAYLARSLIENA
jgi:hypothetical protein